MSEFKIDLFELCFLTEVCIPPVPIARAMFWEKICDEYYNQMTDSERNKMFEWIIKHPNFNTDNEDCHLFFARYNPKNQFKIGYSYEGKSEEIMCFLFNGKYHTSKTVHVANEYIVSDVLVERKSESQLDIQSGIQQAKIMWQNNCKHDKGYITGVAGESSKCAICGKNWN